MKQTDHHQLAEEARKLETEIVEQEEAVKAARVTEGEGSKKVKDLEYKIKNAKQLKEKELKDADIDVKKSKKAVESAKAKWSAKEGEEAALRMEIQELKASIAKAEEEIKSCEEAVSGFEGDITNLKETVAEARKIVAEAKEAVKVQKEAMQKNNKDINSLGSKHEKLAKDNKEKELKVQELNHKIDKASGDAKEALKRIEYMMRQYEWISVDRKFFGEAGSAYDFKVQFSFSFPCTFTLSNGKATMSYYPN